MLVVKTIKKGIKCILEWKHWKTALETTVAISTIASLLVVFWTLQEMQIQRDRAYSPCIVIEDKQVPITRED